MRQLLHAVEAPAKEATLVRDCEIVPIAGHNLDNLLRDSYFLWCSVTHFKERSDLGLILASLTTLSECVITHCPDLPFAVEHADMVNS